MRTKKRRAVMKNAPAKGDATLEEFEARDLGGDAREVAINVRPQRPTSILIGEDLIAKLKAKATKKGIKYQTLMKMIVREHIDEY